VGVRHDVQKSRLQVLGKKNTFRCIYFIMKDRSYFIMKGRSYFIMKGRSYFIMKDRSYFIMTIKKTSLMTFARHETQNKILTFTLYYRENIYLLP